VTEALLAVASFKRSKRLESKNSSSLVIPTNKKSLLYGGFFVGGHYNRPLELVKHKFDYKAKADGKTPVAIAIAAVNVQTFEKCLLSSLVIL